jgi:D-alanyl-D-alanine dipeptidase
MAALNTPLVAITVASIYNHGPLPSRMAQCTPDTAAAIKAVVNDLQGLGHELRLSDLFRSYDMQKQANLDFTQGRKTAFSPPPGGSMHEAGRAMDIDLASIGVPLSKFWEIAGAHGFSPIIDSPDASRSEAWHFDCRGSHDAVY